VAIKYINGCQNRSRSKFTQIAIFGLKINHLATLRLNSDQFGTKFAFESNEKGTILLARRHRCMYVGGEQSRGPFLTTPLAPRGELGPKG
jgi:hypothetical protein